MNQAHSCPDNCSAMRIIYTPLPFPASCSYSHDSVYTRTAEGKAVHTRIFEMMHLQMMQLGYNL